MAAAKQSAEERRAKMMAAATRRTEPEAAPPGRTAIRSKPVRITIDLDPELYRELTAWTTKAAEELDIPRVTQADAIRAMVKTTTLDPSIAVVVLDMIRREKQG